jgi:hypothetical protein
VTTTLIALRRLGTDRPPIGIATGGVAMPGFYRMPDNEQQVMRP